MELTAENLQKEININGVLKTPIQHLQDKLLYGDKYKSTWYVKHSNPTKLTNILFVLDYANNTVIIIDLVDYKQNQYWIIEELQNLGFKFNNQSNKTFFLFGEQAVKVYIDESFPKLISKLDTVDWNTFCFDSYVNKPIEILTAYNGWGDYTEITELEYNILNDID